MEIALFISLPILIAFSLAIAINTKGLVNSNRKILDILQVILDSANSELPPNQPNAKLERLGEEDKEEDDEFADTRNRMAESTSVWEEDALEPEEIEQLS